MLEDDIVLVAAGDDPHGIAERVQLGLSTDSPVTCAVSTTDELAGLPDAYRSAARSVRLLLSLGRVGALGTDTTLAPYALLFGEHNREDLDRFLDATVGPLIAVGPEPFGGPRAHALDLSGLGQSTAEASQALHIHPNTLRQRLERVAAVLSAWRDPTRILEIHMALRLEAIRTGIASPPKRGTLRWAWCAGGLRSRGS